MRLAKLILNGFKSFADRTVLTFDAPVTGIVGPNGCGKSNVVDGVKWVLGEQSAKSLRGDAMADVIFNGSGGRKPAGMAEVTLVFTNPLEEKGGRKLALETDEVQVSRRLYRDGASEYLLNGRVVRLKDIRELFLDTGVGVDAYSVIEQGRVAAMLEANPQERREIFEEAAGISKFKQRRKEASRKLEKVQESLGRVQDVLTEVERNGKSLRVQAGKARVHRELSQRLVKLRRAVGVHEFRRLSGLSAELSAAFDDAKFRLDDATGDVNRNRQSLEDVRQEHAAASQTVSNLSLEAVRLEGELKQAHQRGEFLQNKLQALESQKASLDHRAAQAEQDVQSATEHLRAEKQRQSELALVLSAARASVEERQSALRDGQIKLTELTREVEKQQSAAVEAMRQSAAIGSRISGLEAERRGLATQKQKLQARSLQVNQELEAATARSAELSQLVDQLKTEVASLESDVLNRQQAARQMEAKMAELSEKLGAAREYRSGLISRQRVLADLENKGQGVDEGVKTVLAAIKANATQNANGQPSAFADVRGLVADVLRADVEHAQVIECALEGREQWLVLKDGANVAATTEELKKAKGRVWAVAKHQADEQAEDLHAQAADKAVNWNQVLASIGMADTSVRLAIDLVRHEPQDAWLARKLLGNVAIVDTAYQACQLMDYGPSGWTFVAADGVVTQSTSSTTGQRGRVVRVGKGGGTGAAGGLISRRSELEQLAQHIAEAEKRVEAMSTELGGMSAEGREIEKKTAEVRQQVHTARTKLVEQQSQLARVGDVMASFRREQPVLAREIEEIDKADGKRAEESTKLSETQAQAEQNHAQAKERAAAAAASVEAIRSSLAEATEALSAARVRAGEAQQHVLAADESVLRLERALGAARRATEEAKAARQQHEHAHDAAAKEVAESARQVKLCQAKGAQVQEHLQEVKAKAQALALSVKEAQEQFEQAEETGKAVAEEAQSLELRLSEARMRLEGIITRYREDTGEEIEQVCAAMDAAASQANSPIDAEAAQAPSAADDQTAIVVTEAQTDPAQPAAAEEDQPIILADESAVEAAKAEIVQIREKLNRLGGVNTESIDQLAELEKRHTFLTSQLADLSESSKQLQELIDEISRESTARFEATFAAVKEYFQVMFRKLFGGGKADIILELEEPETQPDGTVVMKKLDLLDAGIEIIARPPGKQPVSISQLSGGEKTMTCVALLMSVFKSKPSPFCILDEVDAALDEANNQRFNLIVQEFLDLSQFIIITHSKRTMQIADVLYGVTMQEQGVSKPVAVKFEQVNKDGSISVSTSAPGSKGRGTRMTVHTEEAPEPATITAEETSEKMAGVA